MCQDLDSGRLRAQRPQCVASSGVSCQRGCPSVPLKTLQPVSGASECVQDTLLPVLQKKQQLAQLSLPEATALAAPARQGVGCHG